MAEYLDKDGLEVILNQVKSYIDTAAENAGGDDEVLVDQVLDNGVDVTNTHTDYNSLTPLTNTLVNFAPTPTNAAKLVVSVQSTVKRKNDSADLNTSLSADAVTRGMEFVIGKSYTSYNTTYDYRYTIISATNAVLISDDSDNTAYETYKASSDVAVYFMLYRQTGVCKVSNDDFRSNSKTYSQITRVNHAT